MSSMDSLEMPRLRTKLSWSVKIQYFGLQGSLANTIVSSTRSMSGQPEELRASKTKAQDFFWCGDCSSAESIVVVSRYAVDIYEVRKPSHYYSVYFLEPTPTETCLSL